MRKARRSNMYSMRKPRANYQDYSAITYFALKNLFYVAEKLRHQSMGDAGRVRLSDSWQETIHDDKGKNKSQNTGPKESIQCK